MPGSGFLTFTDGQVLTAAQVNGYLMKQAVMYFATAAARSSGITSPEEGMVTYRADGDVLEFYNGTTWIGLTDLTTTQVLTNKIFQNSEERWNIVAAASTGTINVDANTSLIWYYTTNATANWTLNFRASSTATLSSILSVGDSITITFAAAQGATPYRPTTFQVDGSAVTPLWQGGTAPTAGNASSTDLYNFVILKTAATPTYTVLASQTQFKA
jgi:hypothetical protein